MSGERLQSDTDGCGDDRHRWPEATRRIRRKEKGCYDLVCITGLTTHARKKIIDDCLAAGMDQVLTKPVETKALRATIEECLVEV